MTVYVDDMRRPFGRMVMCHMMADSTEELLAMAERIGSQREWIQNPGQPGREHMDIPLFRREAAILAGAVPVTGREMGAYCWHMRVYGYPIPPADALAKMKDGTATGGAA